MAQLYTSAFSYAYGLCKTHAATLQLSTGNISASSLSYNLYNNTYAVTAVFNVTLPSGTTSATLQKAIYYCMDASNNQPLHMEITFNTAVQNGTYVLYITSPMPQDQNMSVTLS